MVEICKANDQYNYIRCVSDDLAEVDKFTRIINRIEDKYFDNTYQTWVCNVKDSLHIYDLFYDPDIAVNTKLPPYLYQKQCIYKCMDKSRLIQLPCGTGKSLIGLALLLYVKENDKSFAGPAIFVVKATLKIQWLDEVSKFTDFKASVIDTYKSCTSKYLRKIKKCEDKINELMKISAIKNKDKISELNDEISEVKEQASSVFAEMFNSSNDILILNYETLADDIVRNTLVNINPQFFYVDEIDCIKDPDTKRNKNLNVFNNAKYKFGATATPIRKNPVDLFGIFSFLKPDLFTNRYVFEDRFTKKYYNRVCGSKNEKELTNIIYPYIFTRTLEEVSDQMPKQVVVQKYCELTDKQLKMHKKLMAEIEEFKSQQELIAARISPNLLKSNKEYERLNGNIVARQTFAQMLCDSEELLQMSDSNLSKQYITKSPSTKIALCIELVKAIINSGEKVCIFSRFLGIQDILEREINKLNIENLEVAKITGGVNNEDRHEAVKYYNTSSTCNILLASDAAEAGLNLPNTKYMIEFDLADSDAKQTQRHGRITRADSIHKNVIVYQLIAEESYDEIAQMIIEKKAKYAEDIL